MEEILKEFAELDIHNSKDFLENLKIDIDEDNGYLIPMIIYIAMKHSNRTVDKVPRNSSADHISIFKILNIIISKILNRERNHIDEFKPYFDVGLEEDSRINEIFKNTHNNLFEINFIVSLKEKYWTPSLHDKNTLYFSIAEHMRRSALNVLSVKAEYKSYSKEIRNILDNPNDFDTINFHLSHKLEDLSILTKGMKEEWNSFFEEKQYSTEDIINFRGFIAYLGTYNKVWYRQEQLYDLFKVYIAEYNQQSLSFERFSSLLDLFSLDPNKIVEWDIQVPFIKIGEWYAFWFFYFHAMSPDLTLITLLMRKFPREWNEKIGSKMAKVSMYLTEALPQYPNVSRVSEKKRKNLGDIDIGIYDIHNDHLLLCEVKSVFDKFRTNYQFSNFKNQKVNFNKAILQLRRNVDAIAGGDWRMHDIFKINLSKTPNKITPIILTWWDVVNPTNGTSDEDIICCNFKTFKYLYTVFHGNADKIVTAIKVLSAIHCPSRLVYNEVIYENDVIPYIREIQTDVLPPNTVIEKLVPNNFDELILEIDSLPKFPDNWESVENAENWKVY